VIRFTARVLDPLYRTAAIKRGMLLAASKYKVLISHGSAVGLSAEDLTVAGARPAIVQKLKYVGAWLCSDGSISVKAPLVCVLNAALFSFWATIRGSVDTVENRLAIFRASIWGAAMFYLPLIVEDDAATLQDMRRRIADRLLGFLQIPSSAYDDAEKLAFSEFTGVPDPEEEAARLRQNALTEFAAAGIRSDPGLWGLAFTENPGLMAVAANRRHLQPMHLRVLGPPPEACPVYSSAADGKADELHIVVSDSGWRVFRSGLEISAGVIRSCPSMWEQAPQKCAVAQKAAWAAVFALDQDFELEGMKLVIWGCEGICRRSAEELFVHNLLWKKLLRLRRNGVTVVLARGDGGQIGETGGEAPVGDAEIKVYDPYNFWSPPTELAEGPGGLTVEKLFQYSPDRREEILRAVAR